MSNNNKLNEAKQIVVDVEKEMIANKLICPYEIAYAIKSLNEAIDALQKEDLVESD